MMYITIISVGINCALTKEDICSNIISMSSKQDFEEVISKINPDISWDIFDIEHKVNVLSQLWKESFPKMEFNPYTTVNPWTLGYEEVTPPASIQDDILYINFLFNEVTKHLYLWNE